MPTGPADDPGHEPAMGARAPAPRGRAFALNVPLPGHHIINASTTTELERRPRVGDHVWIVEEIVSLSDEKTTRLGTGVFITSLTTYTDQHGENIARNTNVLFRYDTAQ